MKTLLMVTFVCLTGQYGSMADDNQLFNLLGKSPRPEASLVKAIQGIQLEKQLQQLQLNNNNNNLLSNLIYNPGIVSNQVGPFSSDIASDFADHDEVAFDKKANPNDPFSVLEYPIPRHVQEWLIGAAVKIFREYCKRNSRFPPCKLLALSPANVATVAATKS